MLSGKRSSLEYQRTFSKIKLMRCESIIDLPHKDSRKGVRVKESQGTQDRDFPRKTPDIRT